MSKSALILIFALLFAGSALAAGEGTVGIGYQFNDETGNLGVNQPTFNDYEGFGLSFENFKYKLENGIMLHSNLRNITLNNRNLNFGISKSGLFGIKLSNNQYRRIYDFDGDLSTRRHSTSGSIWYYPMKQIKLYGGGKYIGKSGEQVALFDPTSGEIVNIDYKQKESSAGIQLSHHTSTLTAEYRTIDFDSDIDQERTSFIIFGSFVMPNYDWFRASGGFRRFETSFTESGFMIGSNRGWGNFKFDLPKDFMAQYSFIFDRTGSDSDIVATDNIAHTIYLGYNKIGRGGLTIGYQNGINDDYDTEIGTNSFYLLGWYKLLQNITATFEMGARSDEVNSGSRLNGDQDIQKHKLSLKYRNRLIGMIRLKFENRTRKNETIGSESKFNRFAVDGSAILKDYGFLSYGYGYATGEYLNSEEMFEFEDHVLFGDYSSPVFSNIQLGSGIVYYRSLRDNDLEQINLRFSGDWYLPKNYSLNITYNVHNFDDLSGFNNRYYTGNIVNISFKKKMIF